MNPAPIPMIAAYTPTPEFWAFATLCAVGLGKAVLQYVTSREARRDREQIAKDALAKEEQDRKNREEDRKLLIALSNVTEEGIAKLDTKGDTRLKALLNSNLVTREFAKKAIDTSNGIKADLQANGVKLITDADKQQAIDAP